MIFEKLKADADSHLGQDSTKCIVSVPANFNSLQRTAVMNSARLAGLDPKIAPSPTLSTVSRFNDTILNMQDVNAAIVVFGGSSFDVSIACLDSGLIEIKGTIGNPYLGGEDFDNEIVNHCIIKFEEQTGVNCRAHPKAMRRLKNEAEKIKRVLTAATSAEIILDSLAEGEDFELSMTREFFEHINQKNFAKIVPLLEELLSIAKVSVDKIKHLIMVGGSSRIPYVSKTI